MITPLGNRILCKRLEASQKWGEIFLPDSAQEQSRQAEVIALGVGKDDEGQDLAFTVKVGDLIVLPPQGSIEITVNGEKHLLIKEPDILAIAAP